MANKTIKTEVLVCGGGCAGLAAALSAARNGAKTLLVERAGFAGGIITTVGLPYFDGLVDKGSGRFVVKGIALELLTDLGAVKRGAKSIDDCRADLVSKYWMTVRIPNIEEVKLLADELLLAQRDRLSVLFHSMACGVETNADRIAAVLIANKDGLVRVEARQVIDCTGDADIAAWAGCPVEMNTTSPLMPMTMHFRIGNVKPRKETQAAAKRALVEARERGELPEFYGPGLIYAFAPDEAYIHATRVPGNATDATDFTRAEMQGRKDAMTMFKAWKASVPGFEDSYYIESGPYIGVRDTRRIVGQKVLTTDDLRSSTRHDDAIATGSWFLDIHPPTTSTDKPFTGSGFQPAPYDISYRTLVPQQISNLLVAGRCHSATQEAAASSRVTATAMALGEAAGCAAALATRSKQDVAELAGTKVRETLGQQNGGPFTDA
ncbi:MAG TPA: FAD-dependent oxidoreductase [Pirellulales bacterium]|nr:FAD-dependent oxidoreductase [Pirellulales bacterium]